MVGCLVLRLYHQLEENSYIEICYTLLSMMVWLMFCQGGRSQVDAGVMVVCCWRMHGRTLDARGAQSVLKDMSSLYLQRPRKCGAMGIILP